MVIFTDNDILALDQRFANEGIPFHARPFNAAKEILGNQFVIGVGSNPQVNDICRAYEKLVPEVNFTWPGKGTGLVASIDRVKKVTVGLVFGSPQITVHGGLGFTSHQEWVAWCRNDPKIASRSEFAFADMFDLVYGVDAASPQDNVKTLWGLAAEQLQLAAESLAQSSRTGSAVIQPICLTAELAMKGTLLHLGVKETDLKDSKQFGHDLKKLSAKMTQQCGHRDDKLLLRKISKFPHYVSSRYQETQLSRLQVIELALDAQFVAASSVRRISGADLAYKIETQGSGLRDNFFP